MARKKEDPNEGDKSARRFTIVQALAFAAHSGGFESDPPEYATPDLERLLLALSNGYDRNPSHIEDMLWHFVRTGELLSIEHFRKMQAGELGEDEDGNPVDEDGNPIGD